MPKASPRWQYCRHFKQLTIHCEFPPERTCTPPPLTQHKVFSRDADSAPEEILLAAQSPVPDLLPLGIPKPRGEVTRISWGGYNLQLTLGWPVADYDETRSFVVHLAHEYLNINKSWKRQNQSHLLVVYSEAVKRYPILDRYVNCWVVSDMLLRASHPPASNLASQIAISTPAETLFQFSNLASPPILHSPIPMSTPPPVVTTPIAPDRHLPLTVQLPSETLELGRTNRRNRRTSTRSDAAPSRRESSRSRSPDMSHHTPYRSRSPYTATERPTSSMPLSNSVQHDITMGYRERLDPMTDMSTRDSSPIQLRAISPPTQMMNESTDPIATSKPRDPQIHTPALVRPLPLPATIEDQLDWLVARRFLKLSQNVLMPALKNAVDALIPSIVEQLSVGLSNGLKAPLRSQPRSTRKGDISSDTQSSDDGDGLKPHLWRKRPGKRGSKNHLHIHLFSFQNQLVAFHNYLQAKGLLKGKNNSLPQCPPTETVQAFNNDNDCCPTVDNLSIDWSDSLKKSPWNTEVINLLAVDFRMKVENGMYAEVVLNEETMNLDNLRLLCIDKLRCTQTEYRQRARLSKFSNLEDRNRASHELSARSERRQCLDRSNTRKHGTLQRRRKIVEQNRHCNPDTWDTIMLIVNRLDLDGMSGDETDTPLGVIPKVMRRVGLPWLSPDITRLLHAVESFTPATYEENMTVPIGNSSLPRILEQKCTAHNSIAIQKLPRNWYDDDWYKANSSSARAFLGARKLYNIPHLEPYHSHS
ncbi:uncharacterized protein EDB91DRAFT_1250944 [Suillus paluster]|uniref:uncharacterized protein n=1 Tax=Suillus paluster TaxID=48578 RepID=UPI001B869D1B|nr:uncharacterized protein EDB91DRAFT_1250944 [Suillus paluster]KAG1734426.1 hypothetical protein EDB91DRAFT_1250944 [Suillus paluster]